MTDTISIIHMCFTGATVVGGLVLAYLKIKSKESMHNSDEKYACQKDMQDIKTKVAVIENRLDNERELLEKIESTVEHIREKL